MSGAFVLPVCQPQILRVRLLSLNVASTIFSSGRTQRAITTLWRLCYICVRVVVACFGTEGFDADRGHYLGGINFGHGSSRVWPGKASLLPSMIGEKRLWPVHAEGTLVGEATRWACKEHCADSGSRRMRREASGSHWRRSGTRPMKGRGLRADESETTGRAPRTWQTIGENWPGNWPPEWRRCARSSVVEFGEA